MTRPPDSPVVYRLYDPTDRLLYVGSTIQLKSRLGNHKAMAWWYDLVERIRVNTHLTTEQARAAEIDAIRAEAPAFNSKDNGRRYYKLAADDLAVCRNWVHRTGYCRVGTLPPWLRWVDNGQDDGTRGHQAGRIHPMRMRRIRWTPK